jgi:hypothetical protein
MAAQERKAEVVLRQNSTLHNLHLSVSYVICADASFQVSGRYQQI